MDSYTTDAAASDSEYDLAEPVETHVGQDENTGPMAIIIRLLVYYLFRWYVKWRISDQAANMLLKIIYAFFRILGRQQALMKEALIYFPKKLSDLFNSVKFSKKCFNKYAVCPNPACTKLYSLEDITALDGNGQPTGLSCTTCGSHLTTETVLSNGKRRFHPLKIYCYKSIKESLERLLQFPNFYQSCQAWMTRDTPANSLCDIYDGQVWKSFFFPMPSGPQLIQKLDLGLMINCDWFQPFKRRSNISVGVIYAVIANLPREMRFKTENVLLLGILPALSKEPSNLNSFLKPVVEELKEFHRGLQMKVSTGSSVLVTTRIICTASDIPATRKLCGFLGHSAFLGCSKCLKYFSTMTFNNKKKRNYSGFQRDQWTQRTNDSHRANIVKITSAPSKSVREKLEKQYGSRYTALLDLPYFDPVIHHVVDPMHNLFLGTAKMIFKLWLDCDLLRFNNLRKIDELIASLPISSELGRIPTTISSNFGNFTAAEWKNWTLVYSLYCLNGLLPKPHLLCWQTFVLACNRLCQPLLYPEDIHQADLLLMKFCRTVEELYGEGVVTPNMHMHGHLAECIRQYGPMASFWLFSFERFNGLLGMFTNNKRNIEVQLMRKFLAICHSNNPEVDSDCHSDLLAELEDVNTIRFMEDESKGMLMVSQEAYEASKKSLLNISWETIVKNIDDIHLPKRSALISLDKEDLTFLISVYAVLFPKHAITLDLLPSVCKKFSFVDFGPERFRSKSHKKNSNSFILASWANSDGTINSGSYILYPGRIRHFLYHTFATVNPPESFGITLAVVEWYNSTSRSNKFYLPPLVEFSTDRSIPGGPATFLPIQRIAHLLAVNVNHSISPSNTSEKVGIPLSKRTII